MDTSKTYIKMCDCEEIQGLWKPAVADWYWNKVGNINCIRIDRHPTGRHESKIDIDYNEEPNFIWLPRQDQLQEMVYDTNLPRMLQTIADWCDDPYGFGSRPYPKQVAKLKIWSDFIQSLTSMEQLWLAFVMKEKHNKTWTGEEWK